MIQTAAIKLVADACPDDVDVSKVKRWMMPSKQMTPDRQRFRAISLEKMESAGQGSAAVLQEVRAAFANWSKGPL